MDERVLTHTIHDLFVRCKFIVICLLILGELGDTHSLKKSESLAMSTTPCTSNPQLTSWANYNGTVNGTNNNQMSSTSENENQANGYDASGDIANDGINQYLYDGEGRICAVSHYVALLGTTFMTGYLYDADGTRVAKGTLQNMNTCDPSPVGQGGNGFQFSENYVVGPGGEELTMLDGNNNWQRTNVYAGGTLLATYDLVSGNPALHFHIEDPLGTRRMQLSGELANLGQPETDIQSLPFGDGLTTYPDQYAATSDDSTPLHFTGKERDTESGNDYFGARYYASSMGRFMSPDWGPFPMPVPFALRENPQSLNLYNYVLNNPSKSVDRTGHYHCDPDSSTTSTDSDGNVHLTVTKGACHLDPGDFPNLTVAKGLTWFNEHLNPAYHLMAIPVKIAIHTQRLKDDKMVFDAAWGAMTAMMMNPMQSQDQQFDQSAATAINAERDYDNTALYGIGADLQEVVGLIEARFPGSGTAVENAIKSGADITEDSLSKTIQTAQDIKTE